MAFNLAGPQTNDTLCTNGGCTYPAAPLGQPPFTSPKIFVNKQPLQYYEDGKGIPDTVAGTGAPGCQTPQPRTMVINNQTGVYFDKSLPAISNGQCFTDLLGTQRALTIPFQHANIIIGSNL